MSTSVKAIPPDGGWGWMMAVCSLLLHGQTLGVLLSLSIMYVNWIETFEETRGFTSWIISICVAATFGFAPIPAALANRYGYRTIVVIGGLITSSGYIISYFANSVTYLIFSIGLIAGFGNSFGYLSAIAVASIYFDRRRAIAMGIGTSGVGISTIIMAPVLDYMINEYGWRGALLITGASSLHICAFGLLIRPLPTVEVKDIEIEEDLCVDSDGKYDEEAVNKSLLGADDSDRENEQDDLNIHIPDQSSPTSHAASLIDEPRRPCVKFSRFLSNTNDYQSHSRTCSSKNIGCGNDRTSALQSSERPYSSLRELNIKPPRQKITRGKHSLEAIFAGSLKRLGSIHLSSALPYEIMKPHGIVKEEDCGRISSQTDQSVNENCKDNRSRFDSCLQAFTGALRNNLAMLKDPLFLMFGISSLLTNLSYITPAMYLVDRALDSGLDKSTGAFLIAINGVGNVFGRLFFGAITNSVFKDRFLVNIVVLIMAGVSTSVSPLCGSNVILHCIYAGLIGCFIGAYSMLVPVATADIMGVQRAAEAYGLLLTFMGVATLIGPPFAGFLFDRTRSYLLSYVLYGIFLILSSFIILPAAIKRRMKSTEQQLHP